MSKEDLSLTPPDELSEQAKSDWKRERNFIVGPMAIVTTVDREGRVNAALKTNLMSLGSLDRIGFGCKLNHDTYRNIEETEEFVVNLPPREFAAETMTTAVDYSPDINELEKAGLNSISSKEVEPPRIEECIVHYECELDWCKVESNKDYSVIITGEIVAASVEGILSALPSERMSKLMFWVGGPPKADHFGTVGELHGFAITYFLKEKIQEASREELQFE